MRAGIALFLFLVAGSANAASRVSGIHSVAWLQGCWKLVSAESIVEEQWMAPLGDSMVGVSRTVRGDALVGFEVVVLREQGDGLVYEAHPSGQAAAVFRAAVVGESEVRFENPDHDFPQRIGYRLGPSDTLTAWIEGTVGGTERRLVFPYRREGCPGARQPGRAAAAGQRESRRPNQGGRVILDTAALHDFGTRYTAAWCSRDAASVAEFFAENGSLTINDGASSVGRAAITEAAQGFMTAFPDLVVTMDEILDRGDGVLYRWTLSGTNSGPGGTGNLVRISGYEEWTLGADGLIETSQGHFDEAEYLRQLNEGAGGE